MTGGPIFLLHIGPHKTGSTSLQHALVENLSQLARKRWHLELAPDFPQGIHFLPLGLLKKTTEAQATLTRISSNDHRRVVLSSENFSLLSKEAIEQVVRAIGTRRLRVVYFLRNPIERLPSLWQESVKHGYSGSLEDFMDERLKDPLNDPETNSAEQVRPWREIVGRKSLRIHSLDDVPDVVPFFFRTYLGLKTFSPPEGKLNSRLSVAEVEVLRRLGNLGMEVLAKGREAGKFAKLSEEIDKKLSGSGRAYLRQHAFSLDQEPFRQIEAEISRTVNPRKTSLREDKVFGRRSSMAFSVDPVIWERMPSLAGKLEELRASLEKPDSPRK